MEVARRNSKDLTRQPNVINSMKLNFLGHRNSQVGTKKTLLKFTDKRSSVRNKEEDNKANNQTNKKVAQSFCSIRNLLSIISKKFSTKQQIPSLPELRKALHVQSHEQVELIPKIKVEWPLKTIKFSISKEVFWFPNDFLLL